jgi:hypothetical protein
MTIGLAAMLAGLFGVPAVLLWTGHRLRRRPPRWRAAFWGALIAHVTLAPAAMVAAMAPPAEWAPDDRWRGLFGFWALLLGPVIGALIGVARAPRRPHADASDGERRS